MALGGHGLLVGLIGGSCVGVHYISTGTFAAVSSLPVRLHIGLSPHYQMLWDGFAVEDAGGWVGLWVYGEATADIQ